MSRGMNLYRRGAVYWWRRRLTLAVLEKSPISLSLSLLTRELSIARARGAAMTMASEKIRMTIQQRISAGLMTADQASRIAVEEAKAFRTRLIMVDAELVSEPYILPVSPERSKVCLQQFWQGAEEGGLPETIDEAYAERHWPELVPSERKELLALVKRVQPDVGLWIDAATRLQEGGLDPTDVNVALAKRLIIRSRAEVARQAVQGDLLQDWLMMSPDLPQQQPAAQLRPETSLVPASKPVCAPLPAVQVSVDPFADASDANRRILELTPVQLAEHYIIHRYADLAHRENGKRKRTATGEQTLRQIRCAARMLQQAVPPGTPFSLISADQVRDFDSFLDRLPISFGKSPKTRELTLNLSEYCKRVDTRVAEGELSVDEVGLELPTTNKHFRYLQRLRKLIESLCLSLQRVDYGKYTQPDLKDARAAREAYTLEQGEAIFSLSPWTGCQGLDDRLAPGKSIIHDALYWVLLLVWYTGARREEICTIKLVQIRQEHGIDCIDVIDGKTHNAVRRLPIATELKRLGFLAYVEALREADEIRLFPDLEPGKPGKLGDVFYKLWWIYIKPLVPDLVRGQAMHSCRHTVSTELKELGVFPEFRADLMGQSKSKGGEQETRYSKATRLARLMEVADQIPIVTGHLADHLGNSPLLPENLRIPRPVREKKMETSKCHGDD